MIGFCSRNLKLFFKDKSSVFFSLLAVFIIIGLYALFLGDVLVKSLPGISGARYLMDSWIMAGLLSVTSVTTTMGAFGIIVEDRAKKITKDFTSSPISKKSVLGGYILSAVLIGLFMSILALVLAEIYIVSSGGKLMDPMTLLKVLGLIVLSTVANSSLMFFLVSFFNSLNAFMTACTVIGTLIGFLTGIYLPIGNLPAGIQWVVKCFPVSHSAALFRQTMMAAPMEQSFAGAPAQAVAEFEQQMGVTFSFGETVLPAFGSILILIATGAVFYLLSIWNLSRKKR